MSKAPEGQIIRTDLIGADEVTIVKDNVGLISGIAIDHQRAIVYWADHSSELIECADFDGQGRRVIVRSLLVSIFFFLFELS